MFFGSSSQGQISGCNMTRLEGNSGNAVAIFQDAGGSTMRVNLTLFEGCANGQSMFWKNSGSVSTFSECLFLDCVAVVAHRQGDGRDVLARCFFSNTPELKASTFSSGSVLLEDCMWAGPVPGMPASFTASGVQVSNMFTQLVFDARWMLETCGGPAPTKTPDATRTEDFLDSRPKVADGTMAVPSDAVAGSILRPTQRQVATEGDFKMTKIEGSAIVAHPTSVVASDVTVTKVIGVTKIDDTDKHAATKPQIVDTGKIDTKVVPATGPVVSAPPLQESLKPRPSVFVAASGDVVVTNPPRTGVFAAESGHISESHRARPSVVIPPASEVIPTGGKASSGVPVTRGAGGTKQNPSLVFGTQDEVETAGQPPESWVAALTKLQGTNVELGTNVVALSVQLQHPSAPPFKLTLDPGDSETIPAGSGKGDTVVPVDSETGASRVQMVSKGAAPTGVGATAGTLGETDISGTGGFGSDGLSASDTLQPTSEFAGSGPVNGTVPEGVTGQGGDTVIYIPGSDEVPVTGVDVTAGAIGTEGGVDSEQIATIAAAGTKVDATLGAVNSLAPAGTHMPNVASEAPADSEEPQPSGLKATGRQVTKEVPVSEAELTKDPTVSGVFGEPSGATYKTGEVQPSEIGATIVVVSEDPVPSKADITGGFDMSKADIDSVAPQVSAQPVGSGTRFSLVLETEPPAGSEVAEIGTGAFDSQRIGITFDPKVSAPPRVSDGKQFTDVLGGVPTAGVPETHDGPPSVDTVTEHFKDSGTTRGTSRPSRSVKFDVSKILSPTHATNGTSGVAATTRVRPTFAIMVSSLVRSRRIPPTQKPSPSQIFGKTGITATGDATGSGTPGESKVLTSETLEPSDVRMRTRGLDLTDNRVATAVHIVTDSKVQTALRATIADATRWLILSEMARTSDLRGSVGLGPTLRDDLATEIEASLSRRATARFTGSKTLSRSPLRTNFPPASLSASPVATAGASGSPVETPASTATATDEGVAANVMNLTNTWWFWLLIVAGVAILACAVTVVIWRGRRTSGSDAAPKMETNFGFIDPKAVPITCAEDSEMTFISQDNPIFLKDASDGDLSQIYCSSSDAIDFSTVIPADGEMRPRLPPPAQSDSGDDDSAVWAAVTFTKRSSAAPTTAQDEPSDDEQLHLVEEDHHEDEPATGFNQLVLENYADEYDEGVMF